MIRPLSPIPVEDRRRGLTAVADCRRILANRRPTTNHTTKES